MSIGPFKDDRAARAIAGFLSEHDDCGGGFRVNRSRRGSDGPLEVECRGCGETLSQGGASDDAFPAGVAMAAGSGESLPGGPALAGEQRPGILSVPRVQAPSLRVPPWLGDALIWTAILTVVGTLGIGILRHVTDSGSDGVPRLPAGAPTAKPAEAPAPPTATPPAARHAQPGPPVKFAHRTRLAGLSVGVPSGWLPASGGGAVGLMAPEGTGMLRIFASPAPAPKDFAGQAAAFLSGEHPGAAIGKPHPLRVGSTEGTLLRARYDGGTERALVFTSSGTAYLVLARTAGSASVRTRSQTRRALRSVHP